MLEFFGKEGVLHLNDVRFTFASFTYANKAKKLLARANVYSKLIKLGTQETGTGCTHGLSVSGENYYRAVEILRSNNVNYRVINRL